MDQKEFLSVRNCVPVRLDELKCLPLDRFRRNLSCLNQDLEYDIVSLFAMPSEVQHQLNLIVILRDSAGKNLLAGSTQVPDDSYPALTPSCPQACLFECEISEQYGVIPEGNRGSNRPGSRFGCPSGMTPYCSEISHSKRQA